MQKANTQAPPVKISNKQAPNHKQISNFHPVE
jgi:hypothetical protein